ncbi:MAG: glycosyltransferase [Verrucomicrobia bacterium]|nr:glycosyltransferase [Verrucomicrobiota bacterium]NBU09652.1 glycosyltransferase [Pseudomonadota bacterium]NDA65045.1 glycosyltransferase [Verrucomicrobiota bacterium]NDB74295.1 glycosyltransferase [Verrucomicrobiota bacterium]NDD37611.1 glycosyltransferase [Verrucomicrobiota bacterium]
MSRRLKILHVVFSLEPGGMENGVVNVARGLPPDEFEVHVCCLERGGAFVERLPQPGNVVVLNKPPGFSVRAALGVARHAQHIGAHVLHPHNLGPLTYAALASGWGWWKPVLQGEHGVFQGDQGSPARLLQRQRLYQACRKVHTVSESLRRYLIEHGFPAAKITAILNGVDTERFQPVDKAAVRTPLGLPPHGQFIGIVGRFDPNKKHLLLIDAFNRVASQLPGARLVIVGDKGAEKDKIHAAVQASPVRDRIHLAGFQANPTPWYQALDLLAAPSIFEGLSNAVLEAMACGVPCLAHTACGNAEVITSGSDGFLATLDSVELLAAELHRVLSNQTELAAVGQRARARVMQDFSMSAMVRNYARIYREVAGFPP